jgi:hypothetical protein
VHLPFVGRIGTKIAFHVKKKQFKPYNERQKIERAYYYCPDCGATLFPYDQASGLGSFNLSPAMADACCLIATDDSFQQVS